MIIVTDGGGCDDDSDRWWWLWWLYRQMVVLVVMIVINGGDLQTSRSVSWRYSGVKFVIWVRNNSARFEYWKNSDTMRTVSSCALFFADSLQLAATKAVNVISSRKPFDVSNVDAQVFYCRFQLFSSRLTWCSSIALNKLNKLLLDNLSSSFVLLGTWGFGLPSLQNFPPKNPEKPILFWLDD